MNYRFVFLGVLCLMFQNVIAQEESDSNVLRSVKFFFERKIGVESNGAFKLKGIKLEQAYPEGKAIFIKKVEYSNRKDSIIAIVYFRLRIESNVNCKKDISNGYMSWRDFKVSKVETGKSLTIVKGHLISIFGKVEFRKRDTSWVYNNVLTTNAYQIDDVNEKYYKGKFEIGEPAPLFELSIRMMQGTWKTVTGEQIANISDRINIVSCDNDREICVTIKGEPLGRKLWGGYGDFGMINEEDITIKRDIRSTYILLDDKMEKFEIVSVSVSKTNSGEYKFNLGDRPILVWYPKNDIIVIKGLNSRYDLRLVRVGKRPKEF